MSLSLNKSIPQSSTVEKLKPRILQTKSSKQSLLINKENNDLGVEVIRDVEADSFEEAINKLLQLLDTQIFSPIKAPERATLSVNEKMSPSTEPIPDVIPSSFSKPTPSSSEETTHTTDSVPKIPIMLLRKIAKHVIKYPHLNKLLSKDELISLTNYFEMPLSYQFLCFRLFTRLPKWYDINKLASDIKLNLSDYKIGEMYETLNKHSFVFTGKLTLNK